MENTKLVKILRDVTSCILAGLGQTVYGNKPTKNTWTALIY